MLLKRYRYPFMNSHNYEVIAHTWSNGDIDYFNLIDNRNNRTNTVDGKLAPEWLRERVALLRLCDLTRTAEGEPFGRKITSCMLLIYIDRKEYKELLPYVDSRIEYQTQSDYAA